MIVEIITRYARLTTNKVVSDIRRSTGEIRAINCAQERISIHIIIQNRERSHKDLHLEIKDYNDIHFSLLGTRVDRRFKQRHNNITIFVTSVSWADVSQLTETKYS